ncbi:asparaginase [Streptomyces sp. PTM05]|uniref:Asparaginase n=1 Tax=Streptantibioticus parmotrematis TaxID=2873249 RepID=A0ABS7R0F4_9ACTN|nr:asparaginase [Streptantibioticus parmotrematis]MBY8888943.1 asparaginase [Streptantibioticus parmotrematis]
MRNTPSQPSVPVPRTRRPAPPCRVPTHVPIAHLVRGDLVEGVHHGSLAVLGPTGDVMLEAGDTEAAFYPRSALKPLQAVAMVRAGLPIREELLALAAGSHSGEERHVTVARWILAHGDLAEEDLRNPPDLPYGSLARDAWLRRGLGPSRLAHNCSGKHAAMLLTCQVRGWSTKDYLDPGHPLQREIAATIEEFTGQSVAAVSADGCGAPLFAVSLRGLARAARQLAVAVPTDAAAARVATAMRAHPEMVGGTGRDVTRLMRALPGLLAKDGFEGVQFAALRDGRAVAVKISDGGDRARMPVTAAALERAGVNPALLTAFATTPVTGGGMSVGELRAVGLLAGALS